jgi:hypothetical protein
MKLKQVVLSEQGKELNSPNSGIIVYGCIFTSDVDEKGIPRGGLVGNAQTMEKILTVGVDGKAYSYEEFLIHAPISATELRRIADLKSKTDRTVPAPFAPYSIPAT